MTEVGRLGDHGGAVGERRNPTWRRKNHHAHGVTLAATSAMGLSVVAADAQAGALADLLLKNAAQPAVRTGRGIGRAPVAAPVLGYKLHAVQRAAQVRARVELVAPLVFGELLLNAGPARVSGQTDVVDEMAIILAALE